MYTQMDAQIHVRIHTYIQICIYICMHIHLYTCKCVDLCTYMYRYGCMWLHHTHLFRSKAAAAAVTSTGAPMPARV